MAFVTGLHWLSFRPRKTVFVGSGATFVRFSGCIVGAEGFVAARSLLLGFRCGLMFFSAPLCEPCEMREVVSFPRVRSAPLCPPSFISFVSQNLPSQTSSQGGWTSFIPFPIFQLLPSSLQVIPSCALAMTPRAAAFLQCKRRGASTDA